MGLSLIEMAIGVYPIPPPDQKFIDQIFGENSNQPPPKSIPMNVFEQLECISSMPPPRLEHKNISPEFTDFIDRCLKKDPKDRADLKNLLVSNIISCNYWKKKSTESLTNDQIAFSVLFFLYSNIHGSKSMNVNQ